MSKLLRRSVRPYAAAPADAAITLPLDRTEPPVPFRTSIPENPSSVWARYPSARELEMELADRFGVKLESVIVTAGADEALDRACRSCLANGDELLTTSPTFEMIAKYCALSDAEIRDVQWLDGDFPTEAVIRHITEKTKLIILVSPNNPTGNGIPAEAIEQIAMQAPEIPIVLDLAYVEFADADLTQRFLRFPNTVVVRSFSKAWGLPGLRVGYAIGNTELIQGMRAAGGPYSVSARSIEIVRSNLEQFELDMLNYVDRVRNERNRLEEWLGTNGIRFVPSQANFVLLFPNDTNVFDRALYARGMRARTLESLLIARRLTLPGNVEAFDELIAALEEVVEFQSIEL